MTKVTVATGSSSYDAQVGASILGQFAGLLPDKLRAVRCAIITDANLARTWAPRICAALEQCKPLTIEVSAGEGSKSLGQAETICETMARAGMDRSSFVIAVGGGVIGDLAGFVAAIYHRGIPWVNVPTTLLAMVDSAIGGKTAVNLHAGKNLVGAIHQPSLVIADLDTLETLPPREFKQGFAEIIKHGIIRDAAMLDELQQAESSVRFPQGNLEKLIARNLTIKAAIVAADEHETTGTRAVLNFGHTVGHGIERAAGYGTFLHGEAISLGVVAACRLSEKRAGFSTRETEKVVRLLQSFGLPTSLPVTVSREKVMRAVASDKKFERGNVRFVVTPRLGEAYVSSDVTIDDIAEAVEALV